MPRTLTAGMVFLALPALVAAAAPGESTNRTRVTIRGTGSNVAIERTESLPRETAPGAPASGPLEEAIALKAGGANDTVVIAYLRERQNELPSVIAAQDMKRLRRAGAGRSVAAFLATAAAVDIGETGEGYEATASAPSVPPMETDSASYGMPYSYPLVGGYGLSPYLSRPMLRAYPHPRRMTSEPGERVPRRHIPFRATFTRFPFAP